MIHYSGPDVSNSTGERIHRFKVTVTSQGYITLSLGKRTEWGRRI